MQATTDEVAVNANGETEDLPFLLSMMDGLGGGPKSYGHMPAAWAWTPASSGPSKWHLTSVGRAILLISWLNRINDKGRIRTQFHHVIDIVPTIYEAVGITAPDMVNGVTQRPLEGVSWLHLG